MILRLSRLRVPDDRSLEILALVREQVTPRVLEVPGLVTLTYGFRREGAEIGALTVSAWRSFADLEAAMGGPGAADQLRAWLGDLADRVEREHYELVSDPEDVVTLEGAVLGLVWGRLEPNAEAVAHEMVRRVEEAVREAGALALHIARRSGDEGSEILALAHWPSRAALRAFVRGRPQGALDPAFLALLTDWRFETWDCLDLASVLVPPSGPAVVLADDQGRYVDASPGVETVLGVPGVMLIGRSLADLTPPENRNEVAAAWEACLASGHQEGSIELLRPDGRRVHVDFRARANTPEPGVHASILARAGAWPVPPPPFEEVIATAFGSETPVSPASS